jgi:hypothetical protein
MKRILLVATVAAMAMVLMAAGGSTALARDGAGDSSLQLTVMGPRSGVMGGVCKNAPYSGEEINTLDNTLGDGTKIHTETHTKVYRDAEGRTRRETEDMIHIYDPVAGVAYVLNPKTMTARQLKVSVITTDNHDGSAVTVTSSGSVPINASATGSGVGAAEKSFFFQTNSVETTASSSDPDTAIRAEKLAMEKMAAAQTLDQVKADTQARVEILQMTNGASDVGYAFGGGTYSFKTATRAAAKKESLGTQMLEGVLAEGSRSTTTFDIGAMGNDRPVNVVTERWMSGDLQTVMMTKHSDPRTGEEVFRLANVSRGNPDPSLFQLPSGYTLAVEKRIVNK